MALICPNLSDNDVAADFYAIVDRTNDNIAYNLWNKFEGDVDAINTFIDNKLAEATTKIMPSQPQENPIIKLAKRWNINDKGFTESNSLPKSSVEDMKKEAKELGLGIKKASSGSYYFTKGNKLIVPYRDAYQLEKEPGENPIQELQDAMIRWAERNGIEVLALEDLMKRIGADEAYDDKVVGVANILNKLIGLSENKIDITTLPEEVGHFMVEFMLNDVSVQRALDLVTKTDTYAEVKEDYKNVYTEEIDFRKEALGKILAQEVIRQFKNTANNPVRAFLNAIKTKFLKAWNSLLNRDNGRVKAELAKIVDPMAKSLLEGKVIEDTRTTEQVETSVDMLQVEKEDTPQDKKKKTFLDRAISKLEGIQQLRRNISDLGTKSQKFREAQAKIDALKEDVAKARYTEGLLKFIENAETELGVMVDFLNSKDTQATEEYSVDDKNLINLAGMAAQEYQDLIRDLTNAMDATGLTMSEEAADLLRISKNAQEYARQIAGLSLKLQKNIAVYVLEKGNLDYRGNKIDPNFDAKSIVEAAAEDLSAFRLNWGQIKNSQSNILKIAVKLINDKVNEVRRYSVGKARTLLNLQTNIKNFDSKVFYETNAKGEKTGYIVSEYNYGEYYKAMEEMRSKLAKDLGFDNPYDVIKENLSELELEVYTDVWEKFFDKHSQKKKVSVTRNGKEVIVTKTIPSEMYKNAAYAKIKANPEMLAFYEELIKTKVEALNKLPRYLRTEKNKYLIPQVRKTFAERVSFKNMGRNLGQVIKEIGVVEEDETMFGQTGSLGSKIIPIHFNRQLDNMKDLSEDISSVYARYAEMAENFKQMNKISGDMESVRAALHERDYTLKDEKKKGAETKEYEALKNEIEKLILGVTKKAARIKVGGKEYNVTKLSENIASYFRTTNLAFNISTSTAGFFKGSIDKALEDQIGLYTTNSSSNWAAAEYAKNIGQVIASKSSKQKNKMHLLLEQSGVIELERIIKNTNMSRASRTLLNEQIFYSNYMMADYGMKGRTTLAIYDNIRLYKGDFVNYKTFLELKAKEEGKNVDSVRTGIKQQALGKENAEWKALRDKSLYNALEVKNGKIEVKPEFKDKVTDKVLNTADNTVNHVNHILDGTLSPEDKSNVARKWWGSFILMHRGWVLSGLDNRFKKGGMNYETGEWEEGYYRSFLNVTKNMIANTALNKRIGLLSAKEPSAGELRGAKKFMLDLLFMNMVAIIAAMANIKAEGDDEEEDYTWQFTAYQLNRILLETRSFFSVREFVEMIEEPVVAARAIKEISEITTAFAFGDDDIISRGQYEDWTRGGKWWFKRTPIKNIYELQFPKTKNDYIKNIIGSSTYDLLRKEDDEEKDWWEYTPIGNTDGFTKNILQRENND